MNYSTQLNILTTISENIIDIDRELDEMLNTHHLNNTLTEDIISEYKILLSEKSNNIRNNPKKYSEIILKQVSTLPYEYILELTNCLRNINLLNYNTYTNLYTTIDPEYTDFSNNLLHTVSNIIELSIKDINKAINIIINYNNPIELLYDTSIFASSYILDKGLHNELAA